MHDLDQTAQALVPPGKGILAADEGHSSIARRFGNLGIPNTEENRSSRAASPTIGQRPTSMR